MSTKVSWHNVLCPHDYVFVSVIVLLKYIVQYCWCCILLIIALVQRSPWVRHCKLRSHDYFSECWTDGRDVDPCSGKNTQLRCRSAPQVKCRLLRSVVWCLYCRWRSFSCFSESWSSRMCCFVWKFANEIILSVIIELWIYFFVFYFDHLMVFRVSRFINGMPTRNFG